MRIQIIRSARNGAVQSTDRLGRWEWRLVQAGGLIVAKGEGYRTRAACLEAAKKAWAGGPERRRGRVEPEPDSG